MYFDDRERSPSELFMQVSITYVEGGLLISGGIGQTEPSNMAFNASMEVRSLKHSAAKTVERCRAAGRFAGSGSSIA